MSDERNDDEIEAVIAELEELFGALSKLAFEACAIADEAILLTPLHLLPLTKLREARVAAIRVELAAMAVGRRS